MKIETDFWPPTKSEIRHLYDCLVSGISAILMRKDTPGWDLALERTESPNWEERGPARISMKSSLPNREELLSMKHKPGSLSGGRDPRHSATHFQQIKSAKCTQKDNHFLKMCLLEDPWQSWSVRDCLVRPRYATSSGYSHSEQGSLHSYAFFWVIEMKI